MHVKNTLPPDPCACLSIFSTHQYSPWLFTSRWVTSAFCLRLDPATISCGFTSPYLFSELMCFLVIACTQLLTFSRSVKFSLHIFVFLSLKARGAVRRFKICFPFLDAASPRLALCCLNSSFFCFILNATTVCLGLSKSIWTGSGSIGCVILTQGLGLSMNLSVLSNMLFLLTAATLYSDSTSS